MTDSPAIHRLEGSRPAAGWSAILTPGGRSLYVLLSLLLLAQCYWQPRVQAGDLSSHIYNAWLAQLIESGRAQGLMIVNQTTNILFDLMLSGLFKLFGAEAAQRISVSIAVLVFVLGAFFFVSTVSGRRPWHLLSCIAMLAYGWVYHMGFFNFYLSLGLCFWILGLFWTPTLRRAASAVPLFVLAYLAHALPVVWTVFLVGYLLLAQRISARARGAVTAASLFLLVLSHYLIGRHLVTRWSPSQIALSTGLDQVWVFDGKYYIVLIGLLAIWGLLFLELLRHTGARQLATAIPLQICTISAMAVFVLPGTILIPGFHHALVYIAERMSLGVGVCICALLGTAQPRRAVSYGLIMLSLVFFGLLYRDERALNAFEDRMQDTVAQLEPGQRVVNGIDDPDMRVNALAHMIDRVCLGRCFSYANYEPSTAQFRVRAVGINPYVTSDYGESFELQHGTYVLKSRDLPLFKLDFDDVRLVIRNLKAGVPCGSTLWKALPCLLSRS